MTNSSDNKSSDPKNRHPNSHLQSHSKEYLPDFIKTNSAHKRPPHLGTFNAPMNITQRRPDHEPDTRIDKFTFGMVHPVGHLYSLSFLPRARQRMGRNCPELCYH
ncbi:hypothetical protein [Psychrobacter sanguinis]|uniref:hypothetical protein n=1 Tax=Psychrobacter sanguinis TaxID=861445 RepID=UPI001D115E96|nr:hypothetical protein [Psychrobacter sanguinis]MCC3345721.1 hypothetical protein [Psychrobacter sanguinis]